MRKITNKAVSVILVMALCVSTLWGALIPANAATAGLNYTIVGEAEAAGTRTATMTVTLTHPTGMKSGVFDLMFGGDVIDDANFGTKLNDKGETVPDYSNYLTGDINYPLSDLVGEQSVELVHNGWDKTNTATVWAEKDPDGMMNHKKLNGNKLYLSLKHNRVKQLQEQVIILQNLMQLKDTYGLLPVIQISWIRL